MRGNEERRKERKRLVLEIYMSTIKAPLEVATISIFDTSKHATLALRQIKCPKYLQGL